MPIHVEVQEGDSVTRIAGAYGFFPDTIWNDPANADLKQKRKSMDILMPGDIVVVPDKTIKQLAKPTDGQHKFKRKGIPAVLRLQLFDMEEPRANQQYVLTVDGVIYQGSTDGDGVLTAAVPPSAQQGSLTIGPDQFHIVIQLGSLDPSDEVAGVQKRLNNLGFFCGDPSGECNGETQEALKKFQRRFELPVTGEIDAATTQKLEQMNESVSAFPAEPDSLPSEEPDPNA